MKTKHVKVMMMATLVAVAAQAQSKSPVVGPPITPAQHTATLQGASAGKAAAAKSANEVVAAYNVAIGAAKAADFAVGQAVKVVPGGGPAYQGGKILGNIIMTYPVTVQQNLPPLPKYGYVPPTIPEPIKKIVSSMPTGVHY